MIEVEREFWGLCGPALLLQPSHPEWAARIMICWLLNISKGRDSTTLLGCLCQCSVTPTVKKYFLMFRGNLLCFSLFHWLWSCHWAPLKEPGSVLFATSFKCFYTILTSSWAFSSQAERCQLSQPFLIEEILQTSIPSVTLGWILPIILSLVLGTQNWTQHCRCGITMGDQRGKITSFDLLAILRVKQPKTPLAFFTATAFCWLINNLASHRTPTPFSAKPRALSQKII